MPPSITHTLPLSLAPSSSLADAFSNKCSRFRCRLLAASCHRCLLSAFLFASLLVLVSASLSLSLHAFLFLSLSRSLSFVFSFCPSLSHYQSVSFCPSLSLALSSLSHSLSRTPSLPRLSPCLALASRRLSLSFSLSLSFRFCNLTGPSGFARFVLQSSGVLEELVLARRVPEGTQRASSLGGLCPRKHLISISGVSPPHPRSPTVFFVGYLSSGVCGWGFFFERNTPPTNTKNLLPKRQASRKQAGLEKASIEGASLEKESLRRQASRRQALRRQWGLRIQKTTLVKWSLGPDPTPLHPMLHPLMSRSATQEY